MKKTTKKIHIFYKKDVKEKVRKIEKWEKLDSISRRVFYKYNMKSDEKYYYYLKITIDSDTILISKNIAEINVFSNSEFVKRECISYFKLDKKEKKVSSKGAILSDIKDYIPDNLEILDLFKIDFLKPNSKEEFIDDTLYFILNNTIWKNLLLGKITNKNELFKTFFQARFKKIDKFPMKETEKKIRDMFSFYDIDLFFRILRTSKNPHTTIINYDTIKKYPHIEDLSGEAQMLKEKINYNRTYKALDNIHSELSLKILKIKINFSDLDSKNIYKIENIETTYNLYLLQNEIDFYLEGETQKHCIYNYYNAAKKFTNRTSKDLSKNIYLSYRKNNEIIATMEVQITYNEKTNAYDKYRFKQLYGKRNSTLDKEITKEIKSNFKKYFKEIFLQKVPINTKKKIA